MEKPVLDAAIAVLNEGNAAMDRLDAVVRSAPFADAVQTAHACSGTIIVIGMGKSGIIGQKIAATLASTGTTAIYIHAGEALHGDLGAIRVGDVALLISKSGQTSEVLQVIPFLKEQQNRIIAITNEIHSPLGEMADTVLSMETDSEGCPLNLAPMTSSTATLVLGDALAAALIIANDFQPASFARYHPGGNLGWLLTATVGAIIDKGNNPTVSPATPMRKAVEVLVDSRLGAVSVVDDAGVLCGLITDGDLKRIILKNDTNWIDAAVSTYCSSSAPTSIGTDASAAEALDLMENRETQISVLPVVDSNNIPLGLLRIHDVIQSHV